VLATVVILAMFFGMMSFFIKKAGASAPDQLNKPVSTATLTSPVTFPDF